VSHKHFKTPTLLPILGAIFCAFLAGPWTGRNPAQYNIAGILLGIGALLWVVTVMVNRATGQQVKSDLGGLGSHGPVN
jgi:hypothetical protein